jgi:hypothetical protein
MRFVWCVFAAELMFTDEKEFSGYCWSKLLLTHTKKKMNLRKRERIGEIVFIE